MADIKKIRKAAFVLFIVLGLVLLWTVTSCVRNVLWYTTEWNAVTITNTLGGMLLVIAILTICLVILRSTRLDETPFNHRNVKWLKVVAALLVIFEPYMYLSQKIMYTFYPIILPDNTSIEIHSSLGGIVFAAGLVVYCVSLVIAYGISLQTQVDETL